MIIHNKSDFFSFKNIIAEEGKKFLWPGFMNENEINIYISSYRFLFYWMNELTLLWKLIFQCRIKNKQTDETWVDGFLKLQLFVRIGENHSIERFSPDHPGISVSRPGRRYGAGSLLVKTKSWGDEEQPERNRVGCRAQPGS